jgi:serine protease DegS
MAAHSKPILYAAQSVVAGLAIAFVAVMLRPDLVNLHRGPAPVGPPGYAAAVAASSPAVVNIYTERRYPGGFGLSYRGQALGSGVVISAEGYIVTNWHVIQGAEQVRVQLADGRVATPVLVGADPDTELALLRIDLTDLPVITLGRSDSLAVGDIVLAIGNSLGLSHTVTLGIVSAVGRGELGLANFEDFIQTDAAINVGNSGGALVNTRGELVGINTAATERSGRSSPEGIGFAIPVNLVRGVMEQLIEHGRVIRGYLGVDTYLLPPDLAERYGVAGWAVYVDSVAGPAEKAGILPGDVLTHIDGERVSSPRQAMNLVAGGQPGNRVRIRVARQMGQHYEQFETEAVLEDRQSRPRS